MSLFSLSCHTAENISSTFSDYLKYISCLIESQKSEKKKVKNEFTVIKKMSFYQRILDFARAYFWGGGV